MTSSIGAGLSSRVTEMAARRLNTTAEQLSITRLTGDASTRAYFRAAADGASIIISLYREAFDESERAADRLRRLESADPAARLTFANDPCAHIEVTGLFLSSGLPVPPVLASSGRDAILLIEDVGDTRLQDWVEARPAPDARRAYATAIELIVKIQEATEKALGAGSICSHLAFDEAKLRWELGFFFANYFNRYLRVKLDAETANRAQADFKQLCSELASRPRVLTHRDYHARNLMMLADEMFIIDYQDARMGPVTYDLASLVSDPYTALDRTVADELVEHFIEMKSASTVPIPDVDEFRRELELMTVQRMLKAVGTYASQAAVMKNSTYVAYIDPALDRALAAMSALGRFDSTRALIERTRNESGASL